MSVLATVTATANGTTLARTMEAHPELRIEVERCVPLGERMPYVRVTDDDAAAVRRTLLSDPAVEAVETVAPRGDDGLFRIEWDGGIERFTRPITENGGTLLIAIGTGGEWYLTLRFPNCDDFGAFYRGSPELGESPTIRSVHETGTGIDDRPRTALTEDQRELLSLALEAGYFEIPRNTTLDDLGDRLQISDTAASQRLRRGLRTLLETTMRDGS